MIPVRKLGTTSVGTKSIVVGVVDGVTVIIEDPEAALRAYGFGGKELACYLAANPEKAAADLLAMILVEKGFSKILSHSSTTQAVRRAGQGERVLDKALSGRKLPFKDPDILNWTFADFTTISPAPVKGLFQ